MNTMDNFIGLSVILTGFNQTVIAPNLDPVDIKTEYLAEWQKQIASESGNVDLANTILTKYAQLKAQIPALTDQQIGEEMLDDSNGAGFVLACRKLIFLWYMGAWPQLLPSDDPDANGMTASDMLSSKSYTSGLVWKVMQAHPMGDSNYHYGYWNQAPASLDDYTGNSND